MEVAASAVGIASLGIQICQGLLTYYDGWRSYQSDINSTYEAVDALNKTLALLQESLRSDTLDEERAKNVSSCLISCQGTLERLHRKAQKLQRFKNPQGVEKALWHVQRAWYPFRANTLAKLQDLVSEMQERLTIALQILQLDVGKSSRDLLEKLDQRTLRIEQVQMSNDFKRIIDQLSPPDPWSNHTLAFEKRETMTGIWLIESDAYQQWKFGSTQHLWLYGKPGCGKTVLSSIIVEDIKAYCSEEGIAFAMFYFTFSETQKQNYDGLLRSLIAQLAGKEPAMSMLQRISESGNGFSRTDLEQILIAALNCHHTTFLVLDALDEVPEHDSKRRILLEGVEQLAKTSKVKIFATSREMADIRGLMESLSAKPFYVAAKAVDEDIQRYVSSQLENDVKLRSLSNSTKKRIAQTMSEKSDGMFRWAFCQLQQLANLKSTRPSIIEQVLKNLPADLDDTYARMLASIDEIYQKDALTLLQWLVYAQSPPSLIELAEAVIIDPSENSVDRSDRGNIEDTLNLLSGLVTARPDFVSELLGVEEGNHVYRPDTKIRLAHFSVKEYLESARMSTSAIKHFYLESGKGHNFLAKSCLTYLMQYSKDDEKMFSKQDLHTFPLLSYSAKYWYRHSRLQSGGDFALEIVFLHSQAAREWLCIHNPDYNIYDTFEYENDSYGPKGSFELYQACATGLTEVVRQIVHETDIDSEGGAWGSALQAALHHRYEEVAEILLEADAALTTKEHDDALAVVSEKGLERVLQMLLHDRSDLRINRKILGKSISAATRYGYGNIVKMLLKAGVDVSIEAPMLSDGLEKASARGYENIVRMLLEEGVNVNFSAKPESRALLSAARNGNEEIVRMLLKAGADVDAGAESFAGTALQAASENGYEIIVQMLLEAKADVHIQDHNDDNALHKASAEGHERIVQMLLDAGADVDVKSTWGTAIQRASVSGHETVIQMLLDAGANVNATGAWPASALRLVSANGYEKIVRMLLEAGADVNADCGECGNALYGASAHGNERILQMLLDAGADVNSRHGRFENALQVAAREGNERIVQILLDNGADVNARGDYYGTALQLACANGHVSVLQMLLEAGAEVSADGGQFGSALQRASYGGHIDVVQILLAAGAEVNAESGDYGSALKQASMTGSEEVVRILLDAGADVNTRNDHNSSALQSASEKGYDKIVQMLLDAGAHVNAGGGDFGTALRRASKWGHKEIVQMLLNAGANEEDGNSG